MQIKCTRCENKSERIERILDLTVEISGDIETIEEALQQYTSPEILDGDNRYHCTRLIDLLLLVLLVTTIICTLGASIGGHFDSISHVHIYHPIVSFLIRFIYFIQSHSDAILT